MTKSQKYLIPLALISATLAMATLVIKNFETGGEFLSPFSNSLNITSWFKKEFKPNYIVYGYLPYWVLDAKDYLQYDKLTDIAYFGLHINPDGTFKKLGEDGNLDPSYDKWKNSPELKEIIKQSKKHNTRFALTIISHVDEISDRFLDNPRAWDNLYNNLLTELKEKQIKDVNLNFEYVEYTSKEKADKFAAFTKYLNNKLDSEFGESFVVVATFADSAIRERVSSNLTDLGKNSDGIFIMAYDFHRPASETAGPVAPIAGKGVYSDYDLSTMIKDYLSVIAPSKLIMGVPYYGYNWVIEKEEPLARRKEGSDETGYSESQSYASVMETILKVSPQIQWDDIAKTPYFSYLSPATGSLRQVYYENKDSLKAKYDLAKNNNLAGVGIWALGYDGGYTELWNLLYTEFVK